LTSRIQKKENYKCSKGKLMQKLEEKLEDWGSSLSAQDKPSA